MFEVYSIPAAETPEAAVLEWTRSGESVPLFVTASEADAWEIFDALPGAGVLTESGPGFSEIIKYK